MAADAEAERGETGADTESVHETATIPEWKRAEVADLAELIDSHDSVGVVSIAGIPSRQLQVMRSDLHGTARLRVARNSLLVRALEEADGDVSDIADAVSGQVGLIGTDENPFGLYKQLEASKTPAPINAGEVAPNPITIPEGDTGMDPGPFVGDLQQVGAAARIMDGSIHVTEDSTVLDAGEEVSQDLSNVLAELGIEPKEVGLDLRTVHADGVRFEPDELAIDVAEYRADVEAAAAAGHNLSINTAYPTARTAGALLGKGSTDARGLGVAAAIESPDLADDLLSKADSQVRALAAHIDDEEALPEELRGVEESTEDDASDDADVDAESDADADASGEDDGSGDDAPETDETDASDDDDDDDAGDNLGAMFG